VGPARPSRPPAPHKRRARGGWSRRRLPPSGPTRQPPLPQTPLSLSLSCRARCPLPRAAHLPPTRSPARPDALPCPTPARSSAWPDALPCPAPARSSARPGALHCPRPGARPCLGARPRPGALPCPNALAPPRPGSPAPPCASAAAQPRCSPVTARSWRGASAVWRGRPPARPRCLLAARSSAPVCARLVRGVSARPCARACSRGARSTLARLVVPSARRVTSCRGGVLVYP
jgi:hypothetical protein